MPLCSSVPIQIVDIVTSFFTWNNKTNMTEDLLCFSASMACRCLSLHHLLFKNKNKVNNINRSKHIFMGNKTKFNGFLVKKASFVFEQHDFIEILKSIIKAYLDKSIF
jgi:hypothetical protein